MQNNGHTETGKILTSSIVNNFKIKAGKSMLQLQTLDSTWQLKKLYQIFQFELSGSDHD
jgi:hypothetical protein